MASAQHIVALPSSATPSNSELLRLGAQWAQLIRDMESTFAEMNRIEERAWDATPPRPVALAFPIPAQSPLDRKACARWYAAHNRALADAGYGPVSRRAKAIGAAVNRAEGRIARLPARTAQEAAMKARVAAYWGEDDSDVMASLERDLQRAA